MRTLLPGKSSEEPMQPTANHVVHIGIDGLKADCIELAPGGAPNMLQRMREGVTKFSIISKVREYKVHISLNNLN